MLGLSAFRRLAAHSQGLGLPVHVSPVQAEEFATPEPRVERQQHHWGQMIAIDVILTRRQFGIPSGTPPRIPASPCRFELGIPLMQGSP